MDYRHLVNACIAFHFFFFLQLDMEDGDEIDAMLHQTGGTVKAIDYA